MRLFEDPDEPFAGTNIDEKPHFDDSDAYTWIIRKKGLYLLSLTTDNYHDSLSSTIREWIYHQYSKEQIALDAKDEDIMIVGDYDSYKDFDVPLVDNRNMGLLTGRYWSSANIISSWDNDQRFIKNMPLVVDMLKKAFKFPDQKILSTYVDLQIYDEKSDIDGYDQIKQIKDVFKYKSPEQTQAQKDKIQQRIQMHIEADPKKRKMLQKQFGLNSDMSYKFGIPPTIRKYLKNDPSFLNKINWNKWGLNKDEAETLIKNTYALLQEENINENPDFMNRGNIDVVWSEEGVAFAILSKNVMFTRKKGTHLQIYSLIDRIIDEKFSQNEALKLIKSDPDLSFFGDPSKLQHTKLEKLINSFKTWDNRQKGFTGRFWPNKKAISSWQSPQVFLEKIDLVIKLLKYYGIPENVILQYTLDIDPEYLDQNIKSSVITIGDVIKYQLSSQNKEIDKNIGQAHIEVDPIKRKLLKQKMGINPSEFKKKIPNMILRQLQREPEIIDRINWNKWGVSKDDALLGALQLNEILKEDPDRNNFNKYISISSDNVYCFVMLYPDLVAVEHRGYHGNILKLLVEAIENQYSVEQLIEAGRKHDKPILFYGDTSKLADLKEIPNFEKALTSYQKYGFNYIPERTYGFLAGRLWNVPDEPRVISFWKDDKFVLDHLKQVVFMMKSIGLSSEEIGSTLLDFGDRQEDMVYIKDALQNQIQAADKMSKEKEEAMKQAHIETDPEKRKQLKKDLNLIPADKVFKNKFDYIPKMIKRQLAADPSLVDRINWNKWGLNRNDVIVNLINEIAGQSEQKVSNQKFRKRINIPEKYKEILRREPGLISRVDWSKFGITKNQAMKILFPIPPRYAEVLKREPGLINRVDWSKFGIDKDTALKMLTEDADNVVVNGKSLTPSRSDSIAFGYVDGLVFYKKGSNANHQQIYYELKARLAPNYPKMEKALQANNLPAVNHFIKQIVAYLNGRSIDVVGDISGFPKLLKDLYSNDIESLDLVSMTKSLADGNWEKMRDNAYKIRSEVFVVSGRSWTEEKIVSFWNSVNQAKRCVEVFDLIDDVKQYRFEFVDNVGTFYTYDEIRSGSVKKGQKGDMGKLHVTTDPDQRKALKSKLKGDKSDDEFWKDRESTYKKKGGMTSWERERVKNLAENVSDVFDNKGIGSTPNQIDIDYFGFVKPMKPSEFRRLVPPGVSGTETREKIIIPAIKQGKKIAPPFLLVRWDDINKVWRTIDHEGRSRTDAISELFGDNVKMPVHILPMGLRARNITDEMKSALIIPQK